MKIQTIRLEAENKKLSAGKRYFCVSGGHFFVRMKKRRCDVVARRFCFGVLFYTEWRELASLKSW